MVIFAYRNHTYLYIMKRTILSAFAALLMLAGCTETPAPRQVTLLPEADFQTAIDREETNIYTISDPKGLTLQVTNFGARIVALWAPDRDGNMTDVVLGYPTIAEYQTGDGYAGPIVGRYGNRIDEGKFTLDGKEYQVTINDGINHLHGGVGGWSTKVWVVSNQTENSITLGYYSPDGEEGYPGNVSVIVTYLIQGNDLFIEYTAVTDAPTVLNPTSHCYFNLHGDTEKSTNSHLLKINAPFYTPTDDGLIPTGEVASLDGTPLDFRTATAIGERIDADFEAIAFGKGYDHNFVLDKAMPTNDWGMTEAAVLYEPENGIEMTIWTDRPALQFYSGNFFDGTSVGKNGKAFGYRTGIALETQDYPDAPNHSNFPSTVLRPGEEYKHNTIYSFSVK